MRIAWGFLVRILTKENDWNFSILISTPEIQNLNEK